MSGSRTLGKFVGHIIEVMVVISLIALAVSVVDLELIVNNSLLVLFVVIFSATVVSIIIMATDFDKKLDKQHQRLI